MTQATNFGVPTTGPASPDVMASRIQNNFEAALTGHSGNSRPAYAAAGTIWQDASILNTVRVYFFDGTDDILISTIDTASGRVTGAPQPWVDLAGASSIDVGAVTSENIRITGSGASIESLGAAPAGTVRKLRMASSNTLMHSSSLVLPRSSNITTAADDVFEFISEGSGWRCVGTQLASGKTVFSYPLTAFYESAEQTIVAGEQRTLAHGFGVPPKFIAPVLICKTAEFGYSVGDIVPASPQVSSSVLDSYGASFEFSGSTNILVRYGNVANPTFLGTNKTTGGAVNLTNANWRLIMRAWA